MSRGHGTVERFILERLAAPVPDGQWPPWVTVELLAAWHLGADREGEPVMTRDDDNCWRGLSWCRSTDPTAHEHLLGLSVDRSTDLYCAQHLTRSAVESTRRAAKKLADTGAITVQAIKVSNRGRSYLSHFNGRASRTRSPTAMVACRRLLTEDESATEARRAEPWMASARAAMAMLRGR